MVFRVMLHKVENAINVWQNQKRNPKFKNFSKKFVPYMFEKVVPLMCASSWNMKKFILTPSLSIY